MTEICCLTHKFKYCYQNLKIGKSGQNCVKMTSVDPYLCYYSEENRDQAVEEGFGGSCTGGLKIMELNTIGSKDKRLEGLQAMHILKIVFKSVCYIAKLIFHTLQDTLQ